MSRLFADTLFKRLFVLMWLALIASHFIGYFAFHAARPLCRLRMISRSRRQPRARARARRSPRYAHHRLHKTNCHRR